MSVSYLFISELQNKRGYVRNGVQVLSIEDYNLVIDDLNSCLVNSYTLLTASSLVNAIKTDLATKPIHIPPHVETKIKTQYPLEPDISIRFTALMESIGRTIEKVYYDVADVLGNCCSNPQNHTESVHKLVNTHPLNKPQPQAKAIKEVYQV